MKKQIKDISGKVVGMMEKVNGNWQVVNESGGYREVTLKELTDLNDVSRIAKNLSMQIGWSEYETLLDDMSPVQIGIGIGMGIMYATSYRKAARMDLPDWDHNYDKDHNRFNDVIIIFP